MIHTITTSCDLYIVNRDRLWFIERAKGQRKAFWITLGLFSAIAVATYFFIFA